MEGKGSVRGGELYGKGGEGNKLKGGELIGWGAEGDL